MNILRRLGKIKEKLNVSTSAPAYCTCWKKHWTSALEEISQAHEAGRKEDDSKIHPPPDFDKGFCDKCNKPISKEDFSNG